MKENKANGTEIAIITVFHQFFIFLTTQVGGAVKMHIFK